MPVRPRRLSAVLAVALTATMGLLTTTPASAHQAPTIMPIQLLALNDFHGNLQPPQGSSGNVTRLNPDGTTTTFPAGGVEYLATHLRQAREGHANTITVAAGDIIGASPLLSAAFHDEPTIVAMNKLGLSVTAVGNHEFDEGKDELLRMQNGGCRTDDGCYDPSQPFTGADFSFLAANVINDQTDQPLLPPFWVKNINGARIGFIGMTLKGTPNIVTASGVAGLSFLDEVQTANFYSGVLRRLGVNAIVVLLHQGGSPTSSAYNYNCNTPTPGAGVAGDVVDIAKRLDPSIDLVVTGHTHTAYTCDIPDPAGQPRLVTSASSFGRLYTDIEGGYNLATRDFVRTSMTATNVAVSRDVPKAADMTDLITKYNTLIAPIANRTVGYIAGDIPGRGSAKPESPLGDLISDAQLESTSATASGGAVVAFMNPGGIRSDLQYAQSGTEGDGVVTYGEAFTVQPFNNVLTTLTLTGAQIVTLLQQQYSGANLNSPRLLQVSAGFTYSVDLSRAGADRVLTDTIRLAGTPLDLTASYRVTVNNFLAGGGDGFAVLTQGTNPLVGVLDIDSFVAYLTAHSSASNPYPVPAADRITFV